jgi:hypothetical protein
MNTFPGIAVLEGKSLLPWGAGALLKRPVPGRIGVDTELKRLG